MSKKIKQKVRPHRHRPKGRKPGPTPPPRRERRTGMDVPTESDLPWDEDDSWSALRAHASDQTDRVNRILAAAGVGVMPEPVVAVDLWQALITHLHDECEFDRAEVMEFLNRSARGTAIGPVPEREPEGVLAAEGVEPEGPEPGGGETEAA